MRNATSWLRTRTILTLASVLLVGLALPGVAHAMVVTQSSTQPNGSSGTNTYGGIPTRLTWQAQIVGGDPSVSRITLELPTGTDSSEATVAVITLGGPGGLTRIPVNTAPRISGVTITVPFTPSLEPTANIRITVEHLVFAANAGTFEIKSTAETSAGAFPTKSQADKVTITPMNLAERSIYWLNNQPWAQKWNSVKFLDMFLNPQQVVASFAIVFKGWIISLLLVIIGFPLAIPIGLLLAFGKMAKIAPIRWVSSFYVNVIRGTPLFLQIYIAFFGLPLLGINPNKYLLGITVLALNSAAYLAEIFRAGIQSISKGQFEAASSLGMNYWASMRYVIIPQTVKRVLPTMTSEFILLYKDTALLSAVGVFELMLYSKSLAAISGNVTPYVVAAGFYLLVTTPLIRYVRTLEERLAVAEGGAATTPTKKRPKKPKPGEDGWEPAVAGPESGMLASSTEHESR